MDYRKTFAVAFGLFALAPSAQALELIEDPGFRRGFNVLDRDTGQILGTLQMPGSQGAPIWKLAEWGSQSSLYGKQPIQISSGAYKWADAYKALYAAPYETADSDLVLAMNADNEFGGVYRTENDSWPHLLVQQALHQAGNPSIGEMNELLVRFNAKLRYSNRNIKTGYDQSIHASQFVMFYTVQNRNTQSPGFGDYLWLGVPIYDDRYAMLPQSSHVDRGNDNKPGTDKLIYRIASSDVSSTSMHTGGTVEFRGDLLPHAKLALQEAWSRGLLTDSMNYNDYYIGGMNTGWEITGLNIATVQLNDLSLQAYSPRHPKNFEFNTNGDREGWAYHRMTEQFGGPSSGKWYFACDDTDPKLISPALDIDAGSVKKVIIRMANAGNALAASKLQVFWKRSDQDYFSEGKSKTIAIPNDGSWKEHLIDLTGHSQWYGDITAIRIDPVRYGNGSWIAVDYVRFAQ